MASRLSELIVKITGNADGFKGVMAQVNRDLKVSLDRAENTSRGFAKFGQSISSVGQSLTLGFSLPVLGFGVAAVRAAGDIEALKLGLTAVTGSADAAEKQFAELREVAKLPGLGFQEAVRGATNLQAVGFSANESKDILLQFGNALASVGRGREDLEETIRQLGQLGSRGVVTADNLRPLIERVPQLAGIIKRNFGPEALGNPAETFGKLGVSSARFIEIVRLELGKAERVSGGIKNAFENLRESITLSLAESGEALKPFTKRLIDDFAVPGVEKLSQLAKEFARLPGPIQDVSVALAGISVATPLAIVFFGTLAEKAVALRIAFAAAKPVIAGVVGLLQTPAAAVALSIGAAALVAAKAKETFDAWGGALLAAKRAAFEAGAAASQAAEGTGHAGTQAAKTSVAIKDLTASFKSGKISADKFKEEVQAIFGAQFASGAITAVQYAKLVAEALGEKLPNAAEKAAEAAKKAAAEIKAQFSALGIKDTSTELKEAQSAFARLAASGKLGAGQIQEAYQNVVAKLQEARKAALAVQDVFASPENKKALLDSLQRDVTAGIAGVRVPKLVFQVSADIDLPLASNGLEAMKATLPVVVKDALMAVRTLAEFQVKLNELPANVPLLRRLADVFGFTGEELVKVHDRAQDAKRGIANLELQFGDFATVARNTALSILNVIPQADLIDRANKAKRAFEILRDAGGATAFDLQRSFLAAVEASVAAGERLPKATIAQYRKMSAEVQKTLGQVTKASEVMGRQVSLIVNDLAENLTKLAFEGGKLKERLADAFDSIGKAILRAAIEAQLTRILKVITDLGSKVPVLGSVLGAVFGVESLGGGKGKSVLPIASTGLDAMKAALGIGKAGSGAASTLPIASNGLDAMKAALGIGKAGSGAASTLPIASNGLDAMKAALGIGGSAADATAKATTSAASSMASAASSLTSVAGLITGAVSAGASVVTAIGTVRLEGTMNQVERNTAASSIHLVGILEKLNTFIPYLKLSHEATLGLVVPVLREVRDAAKGFVTVKVNVGEGSEDQARLIGSIVERAQALDTTSGDRLLDIHASLIEMRGAIVDWLRVINDSITGTGAQITGGLNRVGDGQLGLLSRIVQGLGALPSVLRSAIPLVSGAIGAVKSALGFGKAVLPIASNGLDAMKGVLGVGSAAAGAAGSVAGGVGKSAAGAAGQAAGMGVSAITGIVTGAVSAISGVVGNFQMAGMNKSLDLIEKATRFSESHLLQIVERGVNTFLAELPNIRGLSEQFLTQHAWRIHDVWDVLKQIRDGARPEEASGKIAEQVNVQVDTSILTAIHDRLRAITDLGIGVFNARGNAGLVVMNAVDAARSAIESIGTVGALATAPIRSESAEPTSTRGELGARNQFDPASVIGLTSGIQPVMEQLLPYLRSIQERMTAVVDRGVGVFNATGNPGLRLAGAGAGGGNNITINIYDAQDAEAAANAVVTRLKRHGIIPSNA